MASAPPRRHRKGRYSIARLSSDTTATLPAYSTTLHNRSTPVLPISRDDDGYDDPPSYEADQDSDGDDADEEGDDPAQNKSALASPPFTFPRHSTRSFAHLPSTARARRPQHNHHRSRPSASMSPLALSPSRLRSRSSSPQRSTSPEDPFLDALLARSIQALEMSNTLLQSSMSTQTSLAALIADDSPPAATGHSQLGTSHADVISSSEQLGVTQDGDKLDSPVDRAGGRPSADVDPISRSLPDNAGLSPLQRRLRSHARLRSSSSSDLHSRDETQAGHASTQHGHTLSGELHFGVTPRACLVASAPRALTQYIDYDPRENGDDVPFQLPSTLGLRAASSTHDVPTPVESPSLITADRDGADDPSTFPLRSQLPARNFRPGRPAPTAPPLQPPRDQPKHVEAPPTQSAVNLLSSLLLRQPHPSASSSKSPPARAGKPRRASHDSAPPVPLSPPRPISYHYEASQTQLPHHSCTPSTPSSSPTMTRLSRSPTPTRHRATPPPPLLLPTSRQMTPPLEVESPSPTSESPSSSPSTDPLPHAVLSVQALRKILTEQPPPPPKGLQPRTRAAVPTVGTSHATASISRLFTRGTHMHAGSEDARQARRSALKQHRSPSSTPMTPTPSPSLATNFLGLQIPGFGSTSASSSGRSTPTTAKRISFAALPDNTTGTVKGRRAKSKTRRKSNSRARDGSASEDGAESWWAAWLMGGPSGFAGAAAGDIPPALGRDTRKSPTTPWGRSFHGVDDFAI